MRNYLEIWFTWASYEPHPSPGPLSYPVFGADADNLMENYRYTKQVNGGDDADWRADEPTQIYFKLDQENLVRILNTPTASYYLWLNTRLPLNPGGNIPGRGDWLVDVTQLKSEGSPRKKWSHGH